MQYRMLNAADIHIYGEHLIRFFSGYQFVLIMAVYIAQEIP